MKECHCEANKAYTALFDGLQGARRYNIKMAGMFQQLSVSSTSANCVLVLGVEVDATETAASKTVTEKVYGHLHTNSHDSESVGILAVSSIVSLGSVSLRSLLERTYQ